MAKCISRAGGDSSGGSSPQGVSRGAKPGRLTAAGVEKALRGLIRPDKATFLPKFFQAYPGGYGEGDQFLGVVVPDQRRVARQFRQLELAEIGKLLGSPWHECRLTGVLILVDQFERVLAAEKGSSGPRAKKTVRARKEAGLQPASGAPPTTASAADLLQYYLRHTAALNNWDLVDSSAHKILGAWLVEHPQDRKILVRLASSKVLWEQRLAVIATLSLIRQGDYADTLQLAEQFLDHPHDLLHKAVGWMLREVGNRDLKVLRGFLSEYAGRMPRTMLRYAIEKLSASERKKWMTHVA